MPSRELIELRMPEGGAERETVWFMHHRCPQSRPLIAEFENGDIDLVIFPVGLIGWEMPSGVAFDVETTTPCGACGQFLRSWFMWKSPLIITSGTTKA